MNKNHIKVHLPKDISLSHCLQFVESFMHHPSIDNIQIAYESSIRAKRKALDPLIQAALRQKYREIGRMLDSFESREPDE